MTVMASAALYYAATGGRVNASAAGLGPARDQHFRLQLRELEADLATGRLAAAEAVAAKAELAREVLRQQREAGMRRVVTSSRTTPLLLTSIAAAALIAFVAYGFLGRPNLPSQPFAARTEASTGAATINLDDAVKTVEARLAAQPDDLRGWQVIAPIYMQDGRYADAERAFRHILELSAPTADSDTDLAEALMMENGGQATGEAADLLRRAAALDPHHIRSRFYLAAEAMRSKDYPSAVKQWTDVIALGQGDEPWMPTAKAGLATAEAGRDGKLPPDAAAGNPAQSPAILNMVQGLSDRLQTQGGPLADWTQLVRSEIVLGNLAKAQAAYDAARKAYPDAGERAELDTLAAQAGLRLDGGGE
jgi:cytochrome c-type biogenesis protein CcmH